MSDLRATLNPQIDRVIFSPTNPDDVAKALAGIDKVTSAQYDTCGIINAKPGALYISSTPESKHTKRGIL